ncbi:S8 family peptidase [Deinococcus aquaedulcis]|uniref:S8 family peptidase n=1 Tax=Deinococcus aquaedulcis TaxID=2840455 RepID=UPI001C83A2F3|nr:S8 family peptidase [Deinococcus aquaedulcis]
MNARLPSVFLALTVALAACGSPGAPSSDSGANLRGGAPLLGTSNPDAIPGQYIVVLKDSAPNLTAQDSAGLIRALNLDPQGVTIQHIYGAALNGFAAKLSAQNLETLLNNPNVEYIEQDGEMFMTATQTGATWGLDRIDQRNLPLNGTYVYNSTASGVRAYILDTGIRTSHTQFGGRAVWGTNTTGDGNNTDCQGHGTHVAGTVGSATYGVAKGVTLIAVKVLNCQGSGSYSGIIAGINWSLNNKGSGPAVANMSLGGGFSQSVNSAVNNASAQNLVMVVAAGNSNANACNYSPASAASAITVGSTTSSDARSSFSNFGSCVDLFAPGSSITSTWNTSNTATNTISGTSMASPHVAGAAALRIASGLGTTGGVTNAILSSATTGKVTNPGTGSPNRLLYTGP